KLAIPLVVVKGSIALLEILFRRLGTVQSTERLLLIRCVLLLSAGPQAERVLAHLHLAALGMVGVLLRQRSVRVLTFRVIGVAGVVAIGIRLSRLLDEIVINVASCQQ